MGAWHEQALIDAPVADVWELVGDPRSYPRWVGEEVAKVTGLPEVEKGARYEQTGRAPLVGMSTTTFEIDELEDLHEIRMRCTQSGWYSHWKLTEAAGSTFCDVEIGMDPVNVGYRAVDVVSGKRWYRRVARRSLDGIKLALAREPAA